MRLKNTLLLSAGLSALLSMPNIAFAQRLETWARNYVGTPSFRLSQDQRLEQLLREQERAESVLRPVVEQLRGLRAQLQTKREEAQKTQASLNQLREQVTNAINQKTELEERQKTLSTQIQQRQEELQLANVALNALKQEVEQLEARKTQISENLQRVKTECESTPNPRCEQQIERITANLARVEGEIAQKKQLETSAQTKVTGLQQEQQQARQQLQNATQRIAQIDEQNRTRAQEVQTLQAKLEGLKQEAASLNAQMTPLENRENQLSRNLAQATERRQAYEDLLIQRVLFANAQGAQQGHVDGRADGEELAQQVAFDVGSRDGQEDGERDGRRDGRERSYQEGLSRGDRAGAIRAEQEGTRDGERTGRIAGNTEAGHQEGMRIGRQQAVESDASRVGQQQGTSAGLDRAVTTGKMIGEQRGEAQAVAEYEKQPLKAHEIQGAFHGTFNRATPGFPAGHRGPRVNPQIGAQFARMVVRQAYMDGHQARYRAALRNTYDALIDGLYANIYNQAYQANYNDFASRNYPADEDRGFRIGENRAFDRDYPGIRQAAHQRNYEVYFNSPEVDSREYKDALASSRATTYARVYEEIRVDNYDRFEQQTFESNIEEQTEIFRKARYEAVEKVYLEHAVLAFVNDSVHEEGIRGVGARDGIFMPGEPLSHTLTLKNFGKKPAVGVKVQLKSGEVAELPAIPAQSQTTVTRALKSTISGQARPGTTLSTTLVASFAPTTQDHVQTRHHVAGTSQQINLGETKSFRVDYPVQLANLSVASQPIYKSRQGLSIKLSNISQKTINGPVEINLRSNAQTTVLSKTFKPLESLAKGQVSLDGAEFFVNDERDVYSPLSIGATLTVNGVTVGVLTSPLNTMAKAAYEDKPGKPVIIANSDQNRTDFLDVLSDFDGLRNVSVIDTTVMGLNNAALQRGLKNKTIIALARGGAMQAVDRVLAQSQDIAIVLVDDQGQGLGQLAQTQTFTKGLQSKFKLSGLGDLSFLFANPNLNSGVKQPVLAVQGNLRNYRNLLAVANTSRLSADALINEVRSKINQQNFFSPSQTERTLLETLNLLILRDIGLLTQAYTDSGGGLFGSNRDRDIADRVREDQSLLHLKLVKASDVKVNAGNIGLALVGLDTYRVVDNALNTHSQYSRELTTTAINNRLFGGLFVRGAYKGYESDVSGNIRSFNRSLGDTVRRQTTPRFAPFTPAQASSNDFNNR